MALADDIQALTIRTVSALEASHDYYTYTKRMWRLLPQIVREGRKFTFRNLTTGTWVDEKALLGRSQLYVTGYLRSSTFQQFVSLFEDFFFELLRCWLAAYPGSLSKKQVEMGTVLKSPDKIPEQYHRESWETINKVVGDLSAAAIAKARHNVM